MQGGRCGGSRQDDTGEPAGGVKWTGTRPGWGRNRTPPPSTVSTRQPTRSVGMLPVEIPDKGRIQYEAAGNPAALSRTLSLPLHDHTGRCGQDGHQGCRGQVLEDVSGQVGGVSSLRSRPRLTQPAGGVDGTGTRPGCGWNILLFQVQACYPLINTPVAGMTSYHHCC